MLCKRHNGPKNAFVKVTAVPRVMHADKMFGCSPFAHILVRQFEQTGLSLSMHMIDATTARQAHSFTLTL